MIPDGFAPHFRSSPLTDPWEPILSRIDHDPDRPAASAVRLGVELRPAHCNGRGLVHGGLIAALADNAMGLSCALVLGWLEAPGLAPRATEAPDADPAARRPRGLLTMSLSVDYVASGRPGQWLELRPKVIRAGRSAAFAEARIMVDETIAARASAVFRTG